MAENSNVIQNSIPKFDGYYDHWSMLMENLLRSKEFWGLIETGVITAPVNPTAEQQRLADESKLRDLKILAMGESESVNEYFARTLVIANRMTTPGERMEQVTVVEKILRSMPSKFNYVVYAIEESNDVTAMSIDELQCSLLVHEQRMKGQKDHSEEQALKVSNAGRGRGRSASRGRGRGRQSKDLIECYKCHKLGHYRNECSEWEGNVNYAEYQHEEETLLMAYSDSNTEHKEEVWYIDSGCSNHMVGTKEWLFDFDESFRESVKLGNDSKMAVMGKGNVKLSIEGKLHVISDVYYLPGLGNNLLSVGQLQQKGLTVIFRNDMCQWFHEEKGLILTTNMTMNRMYIVTASVMFPRCLQMQKNDESNLCYMRYAHLSIKGLRVLNKKHMVKGLPEMQDIEDKCKDCLSGKQHRESIPKQSNWRANQKLELVHSDICGPISPHSNGGNISPTLAVKDITPEEAWSGSRPSVHHFRIFGCLEHVHIPDAHRTKLDGKSITCVHLGKEGVKPNEQVPDEEDNNDIEIENEVNNAGEEANENDINNVTNSDLDTSQDTYDSTESDELELPPRTRRPPGYLSDYVTGQEQEEIGQIVQNLVIAKFSSHDDPTSYEEAAKHQKWKEAMESEIKSIEENDTWELTVLPQGAKSIGVKWIFKTKYNEEGKIDKYKARLVANGYSQKHGINYGEVFAPVARWDTIRAILSLAAYERWHLELGTGEKGKILIVSVYVDDLIYTGNDELMMAEFKASMKDKFAMTDLGKMKYFLGVEVNQCDQGIFIHQLKYGSEILKRFGMEDCNKVCSPIVPGYKLVKDENARATDATMSPDWNSGHSTYSL
ncbi:hypothetical protein TSUD_82300 [Trifolium subterraneum]|uniref:CCHC-type domain-containing protein n=1 Tax=Trifolium subterraneum TaxID=3900 RepID=A0A2Z6NQY2_TRISU|nr:hypothetical protein TSUD_82300 [Trifolium subterraneum]